MCAIGLADFVNGQDVWMIERRSRLRLLHEAAHTRGVFGKSNRQEFERDLAAELGVFGQINFAHSACTEWRENFVAVQTRACGECHRFTSAIQFSTTVNGGTALS